MKLKQLRIADDLHKILVSRKKADKLRHGTVEQQVDAILRRELKPEKKSKK